MNKRVLYKFTCSYVLYTIYLQNNQKTNWLGENQYSGFALRLHSCLFIYNENQKTLEQKNDLLAILVLDNVRKQILVLDNVRKQILVLDNVRKQIVLLLSSCHWNKKFLKIKSYNLKTSFSRSFFLVPVPVWFIKKRPRKKVLLYWKMHGNKGCLQPWK